MLTSRRLVRTAADDDNVTMRVRVFEYDFLYRFYSKGTYLWDSFISGISLTKVCMNLILWVFKLSRVDSVYEFRILSPQI